LNRRIETERTCKTCHAALRKKRFAAISATPVGNTPAEFSKYVKDEVDKWGKVAKEANVQLN
jgi:tripartite-type tricarboxylate transporter receptor subunit TctC